MLHYDIDDIMMTTKPVRVLQRDIGDVMFSLSYLPSAERLTVVVVKARNIKHPESSKESLGWFSLHLSPSLPLSPSLDRKVV